MVSRRRNVKHLALKACKGNELGENLLTYSTKTKIYGWNRSQLFLRTTAGVFGKQIDPQWVWDARCPSFFICEYYKEGKQRGGYPEKFAIIM
jgi:hypothetical protein